MQRTVIFFWKLRWLRLFLYFSSALYLTTTLGCSAPLLLLLMAPEG
jgi:hypothetical protein